MMDGIQVQLGSEYEVSSLLARGIHFIRSQRSGFFGVLESWPYLSMSNRKE